MRSVDLDEARERLGELLDEVVERGEDLVITREGAPVARIVRVEEPSVPLDLATLRAFREGLPKQEMAAGEFVRWMRDADSY